MHFAKSQHLVTVNLHVTILIKEEHPSLHTPYDLKLSASSVFQPRILPEISAIKHSRHSLPSSLKTEISLLTVVGLLKLIKGVTGELVEKDASTLRD